MLKKPACLLFSVFLSINASKMAQAEWTQPNGVRFDEVTHRCINGVTGKPVQYNRGGRDTICSGFQDFTGSFGEHFNKLKAQGKTFLTASNFSGVDIECGADLSGFDLSYSIFRGTTINELKPQGNCKINLKGADLSNVDLRGAHFNADIDVEGADLTGANLSGVDLRRFKNFNKAVINSIGYNDETIFPEGYSPADDYDKEKSIASAYAEDPYAEMDRFLEASDEAFEALGASLSLRNSNKFKKESPQLANPLGGMTIETDEDLAKEINKVLADTRNAGFVKKVSQENAIAK